MACGHCSYRGYLITLTLKDDDQVRTYQRCPKCDDIENYSKAMKELYSSSKPKKKLNQPAVDNVILFPPKKKK